ncbi:unnamed protein product [Nezara viridula]|uniref:Uncharacterized protein n=1 Tax=Nezara viridula TaxID=85310 RepID=A0A9P0HF01_NEZVI|nr:unnamed protein product [Nezara viridula]
MGQIRALKKEIREMSSAKPTQLVDLEELKKSGRPMRELKNYEGKTPEEVMELLDLHCIDLQKKLDLTKYEIGKRIAFEVLGTKERHVKRTEWLTEDRKQNQ